MKANSILFDQPTGTEFGKKGNEDNINNENNLRSQDDLHITEMHMALDIYIYVHSFVVIYDGDNGTDIVISIDINMGLFLLFVLVWL